MKILIIGATGLIGTKLTQALAEKGAAVMVTSRNPEKAKAKFDSRIEVRGWDGRDVARLKSILQGIDGLVNLAGESIAGGLWTGKRKKRLEASRVHTGRSITDAILQLDEKPAFLIQGSATGFYGPGVTSPADETAPCGTGYLAGLTRQWEDSVALLSEAGLRVAYLRTGIVMHPDGGMLPKMTLPFRFYAGTILGNGRQSLSWIHLGDHVRAVLHLIDNEKSSGPYNLVSPNAVTMQQFIAGLSRTLGRPAWLKVPAMFLEAAMGRMASETILASQVIVPAKLMSEGFRFDFPHIGPALEDLIKKGKA